MIQPEHRMYTESGKEVTRLIDKGLTLAFLDHNEAVKKAKECKTYVYDLYARKNYQNEFWGYGVPRK